MNSVSSKRLGRERLELASRHLGEPSHKEHGPAHPDWGLAAMLPGVCPQSPPPWTLRSWMEAPCAFLRRGSHTHTHQEVTID